MPELTSPQSEAFNRNGFIVMPDVFSPQEVAAMLREVEGGGRVADATRSMDDKSGKPALIALWRQIGDDIWGAASTDRRIVSPVQILLREEAAFFHGKVILKLPHTTGGWEWHQDYGYWYDQGFVFPRMISAFIALDPSTTENGCLQVLSGSHHLGRLEHKAVGQQTVVTNRIEQVEPFFERVHCEMTPGSVLFFHCNLLHTSAPNSSEKPRRSFIVCYNALANPQLGERSFEDRACPISEPGGILKFA